MRQLGFVAVAAGTYLAWASTWPIGQAALASWTPAGLTFFRHFIAGLLLVAVSWGAGVGPSWPSREEWAVGLCQFFLYFFLSYLALRNGSPAVTALIAGLYPLIVLQLGRGTGQIFRTWWLVLLAAAGVLILFRWQEISLSPFMIACSVAAAIAMAISVIQPRRTETPWQICRFTGQSMLVGAFASLLDTVAAKS